MMIHPAPRTHVTTLFRIPFIHSHTPTRNPSSSTGIKNRKRKTERGEREESEPLPLPTDRPCNNSANLFTAKIIICKRVCSSHTIPAKSANSCLRAHIHTHTHKQRAVCACTRILHRRMHFKSFLPKIIHNGSCCHKLERGGR